MNIIILGAPGSGKGAQAILLSKYFNVPIISTGEMLRACGKASITGELTNSAPVTILVKARIETDCKAGYILDGYPRTLVQANELRKITVITHVINLRVPFTTLVQRLNNRQREDDTTKSIKNRLNIFRKYTLEVVDYYRMCQGTWKFHEVSGVGSIEDISKIIIQCIKGEKL